jgi:hypothetical protein
MKNKWLPSLVCCIIISLSTFSQEKYNGMNANLSNIYRLSDAKSRSISPENVNGEKGKGGMAEKGTGETAARELGKGWKLSPSVQIKAHSTFTIAEIDGSGSIQHIWMTPTGVWRNSIIRFYWDDEKTASVEAPVGDFFGMGWNQYSPLRSLAVCVNPGSAFNCYWPMPFRKKCRITMENIDNDPMMLYYQVVLLLDGVQGRGQYVGTYLAWGVHNNGWWGEGEIKFYIDDDGEYPTICGTGTEDYFCGSYDFDSHKKNAAGVEESNYTEFNSPYSGLAQIIRGDGHYNVSQRFGLYRWHITDPIRFEKNIRVTIQALGWRSEGRYLPLEDDIASTVFWYQTEPHQAFPVLPNKNELEIN